MRSYPRNSPEAAARIVALMLISDGHVGRAEIDALRTHRIEPLLGLAHGSFDQVVHTLCEDLLASAYGSGSLMCSVDEATLASVLSEIDSPDLQDKVLKLAIAAAQADLHLAEAELRLMRAAHQQWQSTVTAV
ncbi:tellurite resistance TerB family protein [Leptothrix discophora]|uniref:TerB family tellurite resistance protein n=1 Tax=Leptothrix discophora TaxID=89 RepID=A0ABT9G1Y0_LEPDI|nr:TerB family tellurite resistance protein [Leptothrix discophora]MDP4300502.1 TerB family tellurite resistance protein [Leptothrix discophora]